MHVSFLRLPLACFVRRRAVALALLFLCGPVAAELKESIEFSYYTAEPRWYESMARSVVKASPIREGGKAFMGHTAWSVQWNVAWKRMDDGKCAMRTVSTQLHSVVTLPQMKLRDADDQSRFDAFLAALRAHELDHVAIARNAATEIDRRILALPAMPSCELLEASANELGQSLLEEARQKDAAYDTETGHGKTQGALLN